MEKCLSTFGASEYVFTPADPECLQRTLNHARRVTNKQYIGSRANLASLAVADRLCSQVCGAGVYLRHSLSAPSCTAHGTPSGSAAADATRPRPGPVGSWNGRRAWNENERRRRRIGARRRLSPAPPTSHLLLARAALRRTTLDARDGGDVDASCCPRPVRQRAHFRGMQI